MFNIIVTKNALDRISNINEDRILRLSIDGGGCSGFQYNYDFVDTYTNEDYIFTQDKVTIAIDKTSQQFLNNITLDYIEDLAVSYFRITNPNAEFKCGCGNSFSPK